MEELTAQSVLMQDSVNWKLPRWLTLADWKSEHVFAGLVVLLTDSETHAYQEWCPVMAVRENSSELKWLYKYLAAKLICYDHRVHTNSICCPGDKNLNLTQHLELIASEFILINPKCSFHLWPLNIKPATWLRCLQLLGYNQYVYLYYPLSLQ